MAEENVVESAPEPDIHVDPLVHLEKVKLPAQEECEEEMFKMRAKLYRYHTDATESLWKERGVGDIKIMKHKEKGTYRIVMRRDKTLKLCANHALTSDMDLKPHGTSDKALIWSTLSDISDGEAKKEMLCVRFGKPESATEFKEKFEECAGKPNTSSSDKDSSDKLAKDLSSLNVKDENKSSEKSAGDEASPKETATTNGSVEAKENGTKTDETTNKDTQAAPTD